MRDPSNLAEYKKMYLVFNGRWLISAKALKQLAYKHKNKELLKLIEKSREQAKGVDS